MKKIVTEVTDASTQISLEEAQQLYGEEAEVDMEIEFPRPTEDGAVSPRRLPSR